MSPRSNCCVLVASAVVLAIGGGACGGGYDDAELDRLHEEAVKQNALQIGQIPKAADSEGFTLAITGQLKQAVPTLTWPELDKLAQTHVKTVNAQDPSAPDRIVDFRGVLLRDLIDKAAPLPAATEITVVSVDGFRSTVDIADAKKWPILLAIAADDKPIARSVGGPIFMVFPYTDAPELKTKYPDRFWAFYVQSLIVGSEPLKLKVGGQHLDRAALESLPTATYDGTIGWKVGWPAIPVQLRGVRIADVLAAAHLAVPPDGKVVIKGKAWVSHDPNEPVAISAADLEKCQPMLALRWGPDDVRITAKLGGPIAMAMPQTPPECQERYGERYWMSFVEELYVEVK